MAFSKGGHTILKQYIYIRALKGWSYCFGRAAADTLFSDFSVRRTVGS
jgi:hypothetical protein